MWRVSFDQRTPSLGKEKKSSSGDSATNFRSRVGSQGGAPIFWVASRQGSASPAHAAPCGYKEKIPSANGRQTSGTRRLCETGEKIRDCPQDSSRGG